MEQHKEELLVYEIHSAKKIWEKKIQNSEEASIKNFLYQKGYTQEVLQQIK